MSGNRAKRIITLLKRKYGKHKWKWDPNPVDVLVGTILSQNTSDVNSHRAFSELKSKFKNWEEVSNAGENEIRKAIATGGLANTKSRRIKTVLKEIRKRVGKIDLKFLERLSLKEGKEFLDSLPGIGPKTTAVVLMFSFNKPLMPLDTHCTRVSKRLGLIPMKAGAEKTHELMNEIVPNEEKRNFHINLILHGRKICRAQVPLCSACILKKICPRRGVKKCK